MRKSLKRMVVAGAVATAAAVALRRPEAQSALDRAREEAGRRARHVRGIGTGVWYRLRGRHPDPNVSAHGGVDAERAEAVTRAVLAQLRALVPEEAGDVAAVLPEPLRALWTSPAPAAAKG